VGPTSVVVVRTWELFGAFVEHLDYCDEVPQFFSECLRVLCPDGAFRVIVSDGEKYLKARLFRWLGAMSFSPLLCAYEAASASLRNKTEVVIAHFGQGGQHGFSYDYERWHGCWRTSDLSR